MSNQTPREIKCIIFDCDGTLVDSEYLGHLAIELQLKELGIIEYATALMADHRGGKLGDIIKTLEKKHQTHLSDDFVLSFRQRLEKMFESQLIEIDGVSEILGKIKLPICIASGGPIQKIEKSLEVTNLKRYFSENIFSSYEVNIWKPDPGLFLYAAKKMGFEPENCAVIEDSPIGIEAALAAGMQPIFYNPLDLKVTGKEVKVLSHMKELLDVL